jgi:hypothetical protein
MSEDKPETRKKVIVTGRMDPDLLARAKGMAYWTPGLTLSRIMEDALRAHMEKLELENGPKAPPAGPMRMGRVSEPKKVAR